MYWEGCGVQKKSRGEYGLRGQHEPGGWRLSGPFRESDDGGSVKPRKNPSWELESVVWWDFKRWLFMKWQRLCGSGTIFTLFFPHLCIENMEFYRAIAPRCLANVTGANLGQTCSLLFLFYFFFPLIPNLKLIARWVVDNAYFKQLLLTK